MGSCSSSNRDSCSSELVCLTTELQRFAELLFDGTFCSLGQKLVEWHQLDVTSFLDQVTGFLSEHGQLDGHSSSPPQKCSRSVSVRKLGEEPPKPPRAGDAWRNLCLSSSADFPDRLTELVQGRAEMQPARECLLPGSLFVLLALGLDLAVRV